MKKLLIALASAAAITGAAKATGSGVGYYTDFEALQIGSAFDADKADNGSTEGDKYWAIAGGADDNYATVTNVDFKGTVPHATTNNSQKALAIDTSARLSRQVNPGSVGAESFTNSCLYFDGYVQFTAADSLPTTEAGDKLVVWLYGGDEDTDDAVTNALGLATKSATNLVITAGVLNDGIPTRADFLVTTGAAAIAPDTWHRLTIKAFTEEIDSAQIPMFKVYLDGTQLSAGNTEKFPSLVAYNSDREDQFTLTSVSFEGTGAVDDLGFTAADLFPDAAAETFTLTVTAANGSVALFDANEAELTGTGSPWTLPLAQTYFAVFTPNQGVTVTSATFGGAPCEVPEESEGQYIFALDVSGATASSELALVITTTGGQQSEYPTYIDNLPAATKATYQTKYNAWKNEYGADTTSTHGDQFLLNIAPNATAELETATIVLENGAVKITTSPAANLVNGKVSIKTATTLQGLSEANWAEATLSEGVIQVTPGSGATAGFYKVKVDF